MCDKNLLLNKCGAFNTFVVFTSKRTQLTCKNGSIWWSHNSLWKFIVHVCFLITCHRKKTYVINLYTGDIGNRKYVS